MKRFLCFSLCLIGGWIGIQAQYRIYSYEGAVQYKQAGSTQSWQAVKEDVELQAQDSLRIPAKSFVRIEYMPQSRIYKISDKSKGAVYILIRDSRNSLASRIMKCLNISQTRGVVDTMKNSIHAMEVLGAGSRGSGSIDYDELAEQLAWIGAQACSGAESPKLEGITLKRHKLSWGELDFEFENQTDKDYHINVLHVNKKSHSLSLCYVITPEIQANACPITPSGFSTCAMDVFFPDTEDDVYVLIAFKDPYDSDALDNELLYHRTDNAKEVPTEILYMW